MPLFFVFCRDYRPIPELDVYDTNALDDEEYEALSPSARAEVDRLLRKRDREEALGKGRMRPGLLYGITIVLIFNPCCLLPPNLVLYAIVMCQLLIVLRQ